ncbi:hypothetical protein SAMN05216249_10423 [Acetitomaculum ruminis DSM 5522]|uniref:Uncharacterized protein n=1 Tax=Acetitomaculum ruminis DSM 5522 TaxID=1120918 RepID=A0A1I0WG32_9FIRM|nr:hypothetical protein [Acetitomaculum ruminis]SFA86896.1 hypothetical protein SAMN05216249_10423 [Acetitomaculum ruminis DSM 5522]
MKEYEVAIKRKQPTCGGRTPYDSRIIEIETDDPISFVKTEEKEEDLEMKIERSDDGSIVIIIDNPPYHVVEYSFTEI